MFDAVTYALCKKNGSSLPPVSSSDNGKVLVVGPDGWHAATIDNVDRQIWIIATIGDDGSISTTSTVSYEALGQLAGGFTLVANIVDSHESPLATVYLSKKEATDVAFVFEGTYFDLVALKQKSFDVAILIPSPDSSSQVLIAWKESKFIVTLTPTALDYSGTMDKTVAEINTAYRAGQEILFDVRVAGNVTLRSTMTEVYIDTGYDFPSFQANVMVDSATLMKAYTGKTNDGTKQTYQTMVYGV